RLILVFLCAGSGYLISFALLSSPVIAFFGSGMGILLAITVLFLERNFWEVPLSTILGAIVGLVLGLITANLFAFFFLIKFLKDPFLGGSIYILINSILGYLGVSLGWRRGQDFDLSTLKLSSKSSGTEKNLKILDTSVIIDGRIAELVKTGFIEGSFIVPQFVLHELQHIADSPDSQKRARGRRGLEILQGMQQNPDLKITITNQDFPRINEVDRKLIALAIKLEAKIVTNDYNLNKVAELQGVSVLNINQLANALKPAVVPGEIMKVKVIKEGTEPEQGVAYLDDGTMVVIENARRYLGDSVEVSVSSVLQTSAGRMIFTKLKDEVEI
ncbi:MAG: PIN domain-containing protein, partial [Deltaproteobacteria bacterium]